MAKALITINPAGPTGLDFTIDRTALQCAPDPVRFEADLSNVVFQQTAGSNPLIDERFRKLDFYWDFGDSGTWSKPTKLITEHQNKTNALGAFVTHCYQAAGSYDVTLTVTERSVLTSWVLQFATVTKSLTVADPDDVYSGAKTVVINPVGDSDFTGAPAGATQVNSDTFKTADAVWTDEFGSEERRFLFKSGSSFEWEIALQNSSPPPNILFGSYGPGKATIVPEAGGAAYFTNSNYPYTDARFDGLIFEGDWDMSNILLDGTTAGTPNTDFPWTNAAIVPFGPMDLCINNCEISGMRQQALSLNFGSSEAGHYMICDTSVTNCGNQYWIFVDHHELAGASGSIIGCNFFPQSDQIDGGGLRCVPFRDEATTNVHCRSTVMAAMDANNATAKFCNTPRELNSRKIYTIHWSRFEGTANPVSMQANSGVADRTMEINYLFEGNVIVGDYGTQTGALFRSTGGVVRNCHFLQPGGQCFDSTKATAERTGDYTYGQRRFAEFLNLTEVAASGVTIPQATIDAGVDAYNNTFAARRTAAENNIDHSTPTPEAIERRFITNLNDANNIIDGTILSDDNSMGPLTTTALAAPFSIGFKGASSKTNATAYAPDPADVIEAKPDTGSAALAGVTGNLRAYRDITGAVRTYGSEDIGAWQVTGVG